MKPSRSAGAQNQGRRSATRAETTPAAAPQTGGAGSFQPLPPSHDDIARRAYQNWENSGRPDGTDQQHWYNAEQELRGSSEPDRRGAQESESAETETRRSEP
ncbi:MAG TPA: DUF2934 domain-containing protein [Opitutaceae bacterium]|nr:DUF2934 domain-containing protein [Opitutaceae bacterium]